MDMKTLRRQARERMNGACRVCPQCDGKACAGELPGMGGIRTGRDIVEMLLAGADAVAMGTVMFNDPTAPVKALRELEEWMDAHGVKSVSELSGAVEVG